MTYSSLRIEITLARVGQLNDGTVIYGWRRVRDYRSRICPSSTRADNAHHPDRQTVRAA
jgi:hypothetical protein